MSQECKERRSELRFRTDSKQVVEITSLDTPTRGLGTVVDVSRSGLRVRCGAHFSPGGLVRVIAHGLVITAEVRYCQPTEDGAYDTGLRILSARSAETAKEAKDDTPGAKEESEGDGS